MNQNVLTDIVSYNSEDFVADTDNAILERALRNHRPVFQSLFLELPDHLKQCGGHVEMKIDILLSDPPYNIH